VKTAGGFGNSRTVSSLYKLDEAPSSQATARGISYFEFANPQLPNTVIIRDLVPQLLLFDQFTTNRKLILIFLRYIV